MAQLNKLVEETVEKLRKNKNLSVNDYFCEYVLELDYQIPEIGVSDIDTPEEDVYMVLQEICKHVRNKNFRAACKLYGVKLQPENVTTKEIYQKYLAMCKRHNGEWLFDIVNKHLHTYDFTKYFDG